LSSIIYNSQENLIPTTTHNSLLTAQH